MGSDRAETLWRSSFTAAAGVILVGVFGPWLRSGASSRSSFETLDLVERLGFAPDGPFGWAVRAWPLVPLLVVGAVVACWAGRTTLSAWLGIVGGVYVAGVALGVRNAPDGGLVRTGWAVGLTLGGGLFLLGVAAWRVGASVLHRPEATFDEDVT